MRKTRLKTGMIVKVIAGKEKGKTGKVIQVLPRFSRIVVEGLNLTRRHLRARQKGQQGQVVEFSMPIHLSNVQPLGEDGKPKRHRSFHRTTRV